MRKYYTRACNFYYGNYAKKLVKNKKAFPLNGRQNVAFDQLEIFERKTRNKIKSSFYHISEVKKLPNNLRLIVKKDLILKNTEPKRVKEEDNKEESSALGSLGLKPKPAL